MFVFMFVRYNVHNRFSVYLYVYLYLCMYVCMYVYFYVCMCIYFSTILLDPNLRVDQVGVPVLVPKVMTFPKKVSRYYIDKMREMVLNGPEKHPERILFDPRVEM